MPRIKTSLEAFLAISLGSKQTKILKMQISKILILISCVSADSIYQNRIGNNRHLVNLIKSLEVRTTSDLADQLALAMFSKVETRSLAGRYVHLRRNVSSNRKLLGNRRLRSFRK